MEKTVCICGAGTMGRGIALTVAGRGLTTILFDLNTEVISVAAAFIEKELTREVEKKEYRPMKKKKYFSVFYLHHPFLIVAPHSS